MTKPTVFNYADHERALEEIAKLKEDIANLQIRCRIAESEKPDRDCKNCKHNKADGCSRWNCEYEPRDIVERIDFTCDVGETLTLTYALRRLAEDDSMIVGEQYQKAAKKLCDEFRDAFTEEDTGR